MELHTLQSPPFPLGPAALPVPKNGEPEGWEARSRVGRGLGKGEGAHCVGGGRRVSSEGVGAAPPPPSLPRHQPADTTASRGPTTGALIRVLEAQAVRGGAGPPGRSLL